MFTIERCWIDIYGRCRTWAILLKQQGRRSHDTQGRVPPAATAGGQR